MEDNSPRKNGGDQRQLLFDALIAEFNAIRDELIFRSQSADRFAILTITLLTAMLGVGLARENNLLLMVPILGSLLGLLYLNQLRHVMCLTGYVRDVLAPKISKLSASSVLQWEDYLIANRKQFTLLPINFLNAMAPALASVIALVLTWRHFRPVVLSCSFCGEQFAWLIGVIFTGVFIFLWARMELGLSGKRSKNHVASTNSTDVDS